jgi:transcriptional regulator with XRE-family HTH domain
MSDEGKRTTYPHEVVGLMFMQGMSHLKAWRTYFGMSQAELATKTRTTQAQIASYENGKSIPRADTLMRLSNALGVSADP